MGTGCSKDEKAPPVSAGAAPEDARRKYELTVDKVTRVTADCVTIRFRGSKLPVVPPCHHLYFHATLPAVGTVMRPYTPTFSSASRVDILVKRYEGGDLSPHMHNLKPGDRIQVTGPSGTYTWEPARGRKRKVGMVVGGTGITAMYQLLVACLSNSSDDTEFFLVSSFRTERDLLLQTELRKLQQSGRLHMFCTLTQPPFDWLQGKTRVTSMMLRTHMPPDSLQTTILVCGPEAFNRAVENELHALGYAKPHVRVFEGGGPLAASALAAGVPKEYTMDEVKANGWMVINGKVIDVTSFKAKHPGGIVILDGIAAGEATKLFNATNHSEVARRMLDKLTVGLLRGPKLERSGMMSGLDASTTGGVNVTGLYELLGEAKILEIATNLYGKIWADMETGFGELFRSSATLAHATRMLQLFLVQQFGGPRSYGGFYQDPVAIQRIHSNFTIGSRQKDVWLQYMAKTLSETLPAPEAQPQRDLIMAWCEEFADKVVNAR